MMNMLHAKTRNCRRYCMMTQLKQHYRQQWLVWITHSLKNDRNEPRHMAKWFCYRAMPCLTHQNLRKTPWNRLDGISFCPCHNPLTWRHLTITSFHQWDLFSSMGYMLAEQHFSNFEEVWKWLKECFAVKQKQFFWRGIRNLPERWAKCVESDDQYFV